MAGWLGHYNTLTCNHCHAIYDQVSKKAEEDGIKQITFPDGSMIIKETYEKDKPVENQVPTLTIMVKDSQSPHAKDGWLFFMKAPDKPSMFVAGKMCHGCHIAANEKHPFFEQNPTGEFRDFVFIPFLQQ